MLRRLLQSSLLALVAVTPFTARAAIASGSLEVVAVQPAGSADLVLLGHGFNAGLRQGMVCRITRGTTAVAEILLVEVRPSCSAALITSLAPSQSIHAGDPAATKILKT
jgi:hypothetical protein